MPQQATNTMRALVALSLALTILVGVSPRSDAQEPGSDAPVLVEGSGGTATTGRGRALRRRPVAVHLDALRRSGPTTARLDLFADVELDVEVAPVATDAPGWRAWSGTVVGEPHSSVVVGGDADGTSVLVSVPEATYRVRVVPGGAQVVEEVRPVAGEGDDDVPAPPAAASATSADQGGPAVDADLPSYHVIDVLVGFTPSALAQAGSRAILDDEAELAVVVSNQAFDASGINGHFRLAGTYPIAENLTCDHLEPFADDGDGFADGIHDRRDQLGADMVTLFTGAGCGIGYRPFTNAQLTNQTTPFSVVGYTWAVDNLTFPHELGHNLGMAHDRYVMAPGTTTLYPYGYGYVDVPNRFRTVMAYNNRCADAGVYCNRIGMFSNPARLYAGAPTGRASTETDSADASKVLNATFPRVAEMRSRPAPFTSWTRFVQQQARDFQFGASVPASTASNLSAQLTSGQLKPAAHVEGLMRGTFATHHAPVIRLYSAYFRRLPDLSGLDYWVTKSRQGMTVSSMSSKFAASAEFIELYGQLDNEEFVNRIYENVLGRAGEADGVAYWTGVLDRGEKTRGQVMVGFSESGENKTVTAPRVDAVMIYRGLLARMPTSSEITTVVNRFAGGTSRGRMILELMATTPYANRVVK